MPQPRVPFWVPAVEFLLSLVPGVLLAIVSLLSLLIVIREVLRRPDMQLALLMLAAALGVLWWAWAQLPSWFRTTIYRILKRRRERNERGKES